MSLKRKASFSSFQVSSRAVLCSQAVEDVPQHLNSRTRKRFRNDRPDEQLVYEKTLRMLYEAQKRQDAPSPDEPMSFTPPPSDPEALEPRQQTLRKFFQPVQPSSQSSINVDQTSQNTVNRLGIHSDTAQDHGPVMDAEYNQSTSSSGSSTPIFAGSETATDMNMNMNADLLTQRKWIVA